jgi:ribose transport system permease protein
MTVTKPTSTALNQAVPRISLKMWRNTLGLGTTELVVGAALVVLMLATGTLRPEALSAGNLTNVLQAALPLIILAMGQLVVVATGGIDLSVGSVFSLSGMVAGFAFANGYGPVAAAVAGLATGVLVGLLNGFLIAVVRLAPFVVTLITLSAAASLAFIVTNGNSVPISDESFSELYYGHTLGVPNSYLCAFALVIALQLFLSFLVPGRWVYAVGSNERASGLIGVPVKAVTIGAYTFSGACAAFASVLSLSYLSNAEVTSGSGLELQAIAAVVIGGASLLGGRGSAIGALLGALIITAIQNVVNLLGINTFWEGTVTGAVILIAVLADRATNGSGGRSPFAFLRKNTQSKPKNTFKGESA